MCKYISRYSLLFVALWTLSLRAENYVIINQVMYDSPCNEQVIYPPYSNGEFIEIYNAGSESVSLNGWYITNESLTEHFDFPNISISSKGFLQIVFRHENSLSFVLDSLFSPPFVIHNNQVIYQHNVVLANRGDTITLYNANHEIVDQMHYDGTSNLTKPGHLSATNEDNIPGNQCVSLHRTWVEFDAEGNVVPNTSRWQTDYVTFDEHTLPYNTYYEDFLLGEQSLPVDENYILSVVPLDPVSRIDMNGGQPSLSSGIRVRTTLQYMDGLGRVNETVALGITPGKNDLVAVTDYHDKSHAARQWLPVVMKTRGERMDIAAVQAQAQTDYGDDYPYTETEYENSALRRLTKQIRPGESFRSYGAEQTYDLNDAADQVRIYTVGSDSALHADGTYYAEATLYKNTIKDEDDHTLITYTDMQGRKIMEKRDNNTTYYVYDGLGRLCFVLPALPDSKLNNGSYPLNNPYLKATAYCYRYDSKGNMTYRRLPGCEAQYMVYDKYNQLVLKQDGNQRTAGKWTMCAYDSIGRNLYIAEIVLEQTYAELMAFFADKWQVEHFGHNYSFPLKGTGYASRLLKNKNIRLLTVNYYDNYDFLDILPTPVRQKLRFSEESGFVPKYDNSTGLLTGTRTYNLSEEGYTSTAYYYDINGRIIQNRSVEDSIRSVASGIEYLFDGSVARQKTERHIADDIVNEHYRYTYDHAGRGKKVYYQLNNDEEITLSSFSYDSIGRLVQNLLHDNRDTIRYSYDMRNMLTETRNKHFSERLYYADSLPSGVSACHNGNIAAAYIANRDTACTFSYSYDAQNRLLSSVRLTENGTSNSERFTYDEVGNVLSLQRFSNNRKIDDLHYDYWNEGNCLWSVNDNGQDADDYSTIEYHNAETQADTTMRYDANGNLILDIDRGISVIHYNLLNLPDTIQFVNGNQIVNLYDAAGRKYKSITYTVPVTAVTPRYEIMHYTFDTDTVEFLAAEYTGNIENHYSRTDTIQRIHNSIGYYTDSIYFHYIKDHLGNICAVVNSTRDSVIQSTLYYASGVPMTQSFGRDKQPYLYNGKEFVEAHGWNTYDYGFRGYYATIGRFTTMDPLAEQTPWQSPYSYANNNFINSIDWMGLGGATGYNLTGVNSSGVVVYHDDNIWDPRVFLVGDNWKEGDDVTDGLLVGWEIPGYGYVVGKYSDFWFLNGDYFSSSLRSAVAVEGRGHTWQFGFYKNNVPQESQSFIEDRNSTSLFTMTLNGFSLYTGIKGGIRCNEIYWYGKNGNIYSFHQIHKQGGFANSYKIAKNAPIKIAGNVLSGVGIAYNVIGIVSTGEIKPSDVISIAMGAVSFSGVGAIVASGYLAADFTILLFTGSTIGQKLDNKYGSYIIR